MLLGHFAVSVAAKRAVPRVSLGWLFVAGQLLDLIWTVLVLLGVEHVRIVPGITQVNALDLYDMSWSHSLLTALAWGLMLTLIVFVIKRDRAAAWMIGALVPSHWLLDWVAHRPDMQLWPWNPERYGLALWSSRPATIAVEVAMFSGALWLYWQAVGRDRERGIWIFFTVLMLIGVGASFGPLPPNTTVLAMAGLLLWPVSLLADRLDRAARRPSIVGGQIAPGHG
jgi:hypothetical protein